MVFISAAAARDRRQSDILFKSFTIVYIYALDSLGHKNGLRMVWLRGMVLFDLAINQLSCMIELSGFSRNQKPWSGGAVGLPINLEVNRLHLNCG